MSADLDRQISTSFPAALPVLLLARRALRTGSTDVAPTVQRLAAALLRSAGRGTDGRLVRRAEALSTGPRQALPRLLDLFLEACPAAGDEGENALLVVESDPDTAAFVALLLEGDGRRLDVASNLREARRQMAERVPDLVLLDILLPDGDGRDLLVELRGALATRETTIVVLSTERAALPVAECFALGADAMFEKPFEPEVLQAYVADRLHRRGPRVEHGDMRPVSRPG